MRRTNRLKKNGKPGRLNGIKIPRRLKFEPVIMTESGARVRSQYEKTCANWLHKHNIEFIYEPVILIKGQQFRPDFYLPHHDLFIEICGFNHMPYYRDHASHKKQLYEKFGLPTIFINYGGKGSLGSILENELAKRGIIIDRQ